MLVIIGSNQIHVRKPPNQVTYDSDDDACMCFGSAFALLYVPWIGADRRFSVAFGRPGGGWVGAPPNASVHSIPVLLQSFSPFPL